MLALSIPTDGGAFHLEEADRDHGSARAAFGFLLLFVAVYRWLFVSYLFHGRVSWRRTGELCCAKVDYVLSHLKDPCPKRRARYFRCAHRREERRRRKQLQRQTQQQTEDSAESESVGDASESPAALAYSSCVCPFSRAAQLYKLHLPPPLPLCEKNRSRVVSFSEGDEGSQPLPNEVAHDDEELLEDCEAVPQVPEDTVVDSEPESLVRQDSDDRSGGSRCPRDCQKCNVCTAGSNASQGLDPYCQVPVVARPVAALLSPTPLIDLARMQQWKLMLEEGRITRRGAKYRDVDGLCALHWACSGGPPLEVVQALLEAYPSAVKKLDREGSSPLHFATHYAASLSVVDALLKAYPKAASKRDKYGRSPLFHAVEKSSCVRVWRLLIQADPSMILQPCLPPSQQHNSRQGAAGVVAVERTAAVRTPLFLAWIKVMSNRHARTTCQGRYWEKALFLLEAAWRHQESTMRYADTTTNGDDPQQRRQFRFLCAAIRLDLYLPEQVVPLALQADPDQVREPEPTTRLLPLSVAASVVPHTPMRGKVLLKLLLQAHPGAAHDLSPGGRSALVHALLSGKTWNAGVQELWLANPDALRDTDALTALPPALLAASIAQAQVEQEEREQAPDRAEDSPSSVAPARTPSPSVDALLLRDCLDPFRLLTPKQQERLVRAGTSPHGGSRREEEGAMHPGLEGLNTIFELVRADPTATLPQVQKAVGSATSSSLPSLPPLALSRMAATAA